MITTFENRYVFKIYLIVLIPIFDTTYKGGNGSKYTCEIYITNWYFSNKVGIVFAIYQRMISKGTSWAGPRHELWRKSMARKIFLVDLSDSD